MTEQREKYGVDEMGSLAGKMKKEVDATIKLWEALREWRNSIEIMEKTEGVICHKCPECKLIDAYNDWAATQ